MGLTAGTLIATILRFDRKTATYKIALIRAINDIAINYPHLGQAEQVAIPLKAIAKCWVSYYWPFVGESAILQGRKAAGKQEISFRPQLTELRRAWSAQNQLDSDADGFLVAGEASTVGRWKNSYTEQFRTLFQATITAVCDAIKKPIEYAGPGRHELFPLPERWKHLTSTAQAVPGTSDEDFCLLVSGDLWNEFCQLSLWVEALCIHEWCLLTEQLSPGTDRGVVYAALTKRPDNRLSLTWERNLIDLLILEGHRFVCPWTDRPLGVKGYDLDHILPLTAYPINELWNLVPSDPTFNRHRKRDLVPSSQAFRSAVPQLIATYDHYQRLPELRDALNRDSGARFGNAQVSAHWTGEQLAPRVIEFVDAFGQARNLRRF